MSDTITADAITEPGVYDLAEATYFADPALSFSGAKRLLPPSCPAIFRHEQLHGRAPKAAWDFGHAAHAKVLGVGAEVVTVQKVTKDKTKVDADNYNTLSAQKHRDEIYADGKVPLLRKEIEDIDAMAAALRANPVAAALLDPAGGKAEQSLFWRDPTTDLMRRARLDWLPEAVDGRVIVVDYKTCQAADLGSIRRDVAKYKYHSQHAWYVDAVRANGIADDVNFVFVFQMKTAPYLVTPVELDHQAVEAGRAMNDRALALYADCLNTDTWPGFTADIPLISLPAWALTEEQYA